MKLRITVGFYFVSVMVGEGVLYMLQLALDVLILETPSDTFDVIGNCGPMIYSDFQSPTTTP